MLLLPKTVGPYTLQRKLGSGGIAESFLAVPNAGGRPVVVRRALPWVMRDPARLASFEARLADLAGVRHPFLVSIAEPFRADDSLWFVEDHVDGVSLERVLAWCRQHRRALPQNVFLNIATHACNALEALHGRSGRASTAEHVLHLGLKPRAIFLTREGKVVLGSYGLVRSPTLLPSSGASGPAAVRMEYLSPEQSQPDQKLTPAADLFSLGAILFELLTLEPLFLAESNVVTLERVRQADVSAAMVRVRERMPGLDKVLTRALAAQPRHRYQRAFVLREDLRGLMSGYSFASIADDTRAFVAPLLAGTVPEPLLRVADEPIERTERTAPRVAPLAPEPLRASRDPVPLEAVELGGPDGTLGPSPTWSPSDEPEAPLPTGPLRSERPRLASPLDDEATLLQPDEAAPFEEARAAFGSTGMSIFGSAPAGAASEPLSDTAAFLGAAPPARETAGHVEPGTDPVGATLVPDALHDTAAFLDAASPSATPDVYARPPAALEDTAAFLGAPSPVAEPLALPMPEAEPPEEPWAPAPFAARPAVAPAAPPAHAPLAFTPPPVFAPAPIPAAPPVVSAAPEELPPPRRGLPRGAVVATIGVVALVIVGIAAIARSGVDSGPVPTPPTTTATAASVAPAVDAAAVMSDGPPRLAPIDEAPEAATTPAPSSPVPAAPAPPTPEPAARAKAADASSSPVAAVSAPPRAAPQGAAEPRTEPAASRTTPLPARAATSTSSPPAPAPAVAASSRPPAATPPASVDIARDPVGDVVAPDLDALSALAQKGRLANDDIAALEAIDVSAPTYDRSRRLLLMQADRKGDDRATRRYLDQLLLLPENAYDPVVLSTEARWLVNARDYDAALAKATAAERNWGRLPSELVFSKKAEIYESIAAATQGRFYASDGDLELLSRSTRAWERYRAHALTRSRTDLAQRADAEIAKLNAVRERLR